MADVFVTLFLGIGVGVFIGLLFSNERVKKKRQFLTKYFHFINKEESSRTFEDIKSSGEDEDEVSQY